MHYILPIASLIFSFVCYILVRRNRKIIERGIEPNVGERGGVRILPLTIEQGGLAPGTYEIINGKAIRIKTIPDNSVGIIIEND